MQRGDIWWADLPQPAGRRPVVILSREKAVQVREFVTIAEITTKIRNIPTEIQLHRRDGMPKDCVINVDNLYTISKHFLKEKITQLEPDKVRSLAKALKFALDIE